MTGSASQAMDVLYRPIGKPEEECKGGGALSSFRIRGQRMTGSAYQAMDVLSIARASYQRRVQRGDGSQILTPFEAGG